VALGSTAPPAAGVQELFAPAQFFDMSDDDKLAAPAFEAMDAGVAFGDSGYTAGFDAGGVSTFDYTDIIVGPDGIPQLQPEPYHQDGAGVLVMTLMGAAARSGARRALMRRFAAPVSPAAPTIAPERWGAVPVAPPAATPPGATTWAEARGQVLSARDPAAWVLAPTGELVT